MNKQIGNPFILALKAHNLTVEIHHHSAYQIVLSNDTPFTSTINGQLCERIHGFLKPSEFAGEGSVDGTFSALVSVSCWLGSQWLYIRRP